MAATCVRVRNTCALLLSLIVGAARAEAQISFPDQPGPPPEPLSLSISGGISLGAYQAGVNWALLEVFRTAAGNVDFHQSFKIPRYQLRSAAGASAGNINTLLWALEACTRPDRPRPPEESLFWQVWTPLGLPQLLPDDLDPAEAELSLLDREFLRKVVYDRVLRWTRSGSLVEGCEVPVGITLTRIFPDTLEFSGLPVKTQRFATHFRVQVADSSGTRRARFLEPGSVGASRRMGKLALLPTLHPDSAAINDTTVLEAVEASSAFPYAFQPKSLSVLYPENGTPSPNQTFLDGGVFDNNPVTVALEVYRLYRPRTSLDKLRDYQVLQRAPTLLERIPFFGRGASLQQDDRGSTPPAPTLDVLYVNPGRLRDSALAKENRQGSSVAPGGLASVRQLLSGAVPTARQYELQFLARDTLYRARNPFRMLLTDRAMPIFGEHLAAFGAFLGRPLREYDFYAGIYDGLVFAAATYTCPESSFPKKAERKACVAKVAQKLILDERLPLGPVAPPLLAALYENEFSYPIPVSAVERARTPVHGTEHLASDRSRSLSDDRVLVLTALSRALDDALEASGTDRQAAACNELPLAPRLICTDGLRTVAASLRADTTRPVEVLERWARECDAKPAADQADCPADGKFLAFVRNPDRSATRTADRLLDRMSEVEHRMLLGGGADMERLTILLTWLYRVTPLRERKRFDLDPSSIPDHHASPWHLAPPYIGSNLGSVGWEARWRPTYNRKRYLIAVPAIVHLNTSAEGTDPQWFAGTGLGVGMRGPLGGLFGKKADVIVPEMGVEWHRFWAIRHSAALHEWEVYGTLMGGLFRVGARFPSVAGRMHGEEKFGFSLGISDLNGLLYWGTRLAQ